MSRSLPPLGPAPAILFVTATRIGDAVLSTGLLRVLVERYPNARFTVVAGPVAAPLFADVPGLERVIALTKRPYSLHWLDLYREVLTTHWNLVVDLRGSALSWMLLARHRRVGGKGDPARHRVEQLAPVFDLMPPPAPLLWTTARHDAEAARLIPGNQAVLAIGPTANWAGKMWRPERFADLARRLTASGAMLADARVAVFSAPHERGLAEPVLASIPADRLIDMTNAPDLLTVAAALKRCRLFIGNDTGLMHMAAAVGTPTLGLFGPSPTAQYAPWGRHTEVAQTEKSYAELVYAPDFDHRTTGTLMDTLSVDRAEAAAIALLGRVSEAAA